MGNKGCYELGCMSYERDKPGFKKELLDIFSKIQSQYSLETYVICVCV